MGSQEPGADKEEDLDAAERLFLVLLDADDGKAVPGNLWLQKEMFLIAENIEELHDYLKFEPNLQGPYSETVDNIVENLRYLGYITKDGGDIELTKEGEEVVGGIYEGADEELLELIEDVKRFANDLSKDELLVFIYYTYPDMTVESRELEGIEEKRERLADRLYRREKISVEKASELAGKSISEFKRDVSA